MDEESIHITPFTGEKGKWRIWLGQLTTRHGIKGCDNLLTSDKKILADDADETKYKGISELKLFYRTDYNNMILAQEDKVFFQIVE